jgi:hypothetical protein
MVGVGSYDLKEIVEDIDINAFLRYAGDEADT